MGLRFRKRVTILPRVSLNISTSGIGVSAGPRGAKIGLGPRGLHRSIGLPGTGLHFREETTWGALRAARDTGRSGSHSAMAPRPVVLRLRGIGDPKQRRSREAR